VDVACETVDRPGTTQPSPSPTPPPATPPGGSAPQPQPTPPPQSPPAPTVTLVAGQTLDGFVKKGLRVRIACQEACRARALILISRGTARRLAIRSTELARGSARLSAAGRTTLVAKPSARIRRRLARTSRLKTTLETRITRTGASPTTKRMSLTLRRKSPARRRLEALQDAHRLLD
jgi:hypothetical protein